MLKWSKDFYFSKTNSLQVRSSCNYFRDLFCGLDGGLKIMLQNFSSDSSNNYRAVTQLKHPTFLWVSGLPFPPRCSEHFNVFWLNISTSITSSSGKHTLVFLGLEKDRGSLFVPIKAAISVSANQGGREGKKGKNVALLMIQSCHKTRRWRVKHNHQSVELL